MVKTTKEICENYYNLFLQMDDGEWEKVDRQLAGDYTPDEVEAIQKDFVAFTQFVWSNFIGLKLEFEDPIIERIIAAHGSGVLDQLDVSQESLEALRLDSTG